MKIKLPKFSVNEILLTAQVGVAPLLILSAIEGVILVTLFFGLQILLIEAAKILLKQYVLVPKSSFENQGVNSLANRAKRFKKNHDKNKKDK